MAYVIYKTPVDKLPGEPFVVKLPPGAVALSLQVQDGTPVVWWRCFKSAEPDEARKLVVVGTGWEFGDTVGRYTGTWQEPPGFVWHLFEFVG